MPDKRIDVWECPECGERETCDFMCDCCYPAPEAKPRTFVAVDALLSAATVDAAGWAETMALGRIGTDAAEAVISAAVAHALSEDRDA